jgi:hypothetical protein
MLESSQVRARSSATDRSGRAPNRDRASGRRAPAQEVVIVRGEPRDPGLELAPPALAWRGMVRWYDPLYLCRHAKEILFRPAAGQRADPRRALGVGGDRPRFFDYRTHGGRDQDGALWLDYVSDTGDGWDPTYTVARGVGAASLPVGGPPGARGVTVLPRASILVFGGDEVYPVGSGRSYDERLVAPFAAAVRDLADADPHPDVFAVPGNHDWYDNLAAFSHVFLSHRWFAYWHTRQNRSYFALRLPGRWWLLGVDIKLDGDIDGEQLAYFESIGSCMEDDDRVILCNAEPHWIAKALAGARDRPSSSRLGELEARVLQDRTWLHLSGDLHHYRRHTCRSDGRIKITAGGGGAFVHPTHTNLQRISTLTDEVVDERGRKQTRVYELDPGSCFPPPACSRRIVLQNLLPLGVVWRQPLFFAVPAVLYLLTSWLVPLDRVQGGRASSQLLGEQPGAVLWIAAILAGFVALTRVSPVPARLAAGLAHAFVHVGAVLLCAWLAARWTRELDPGGTGTPLLRGLLIFAMGGAIGSTIFGWYLAIMCEAFGVHENGATATQGCTHWKSFLRLRIGPDGDLTIHPIGIARTPRWLRRGYRAGAAAAVPRDGRKDHEIYRHIEPPVVIPARPSGG